MAQRKPTKNCSNTGDKEEEIVVQYNIGDSMTFCFVRSQVLPGSEKNHVCIRFYFYIDVSSLRFLT